MRRLMMSLLLFAAAPASGAEWKEDDPANRTVIDLGLEAVRAVLAQTGAKEKPAVGSEPGLLMAAFPNGINVLLSLEHCDGAGKKCGRLLLLSFLEPPPGWDEARLNQALLNHSSGYQFATLGFVAGPKSPVVTARSIIAEYGMPKGQLYRELTDFAMSVRQVQQVLKTPGAAE
jgi:hypothetical protein